MNMTIKTLGIAFVALEAVDAFLTMWAANTLQGFQEMNPLLAPIAGSWLSPLVKIVPSALIAWGLVRLGNRFPRTRRITAFGMIAVILFLGIVLASNAVEII
jgi:hypothetical protein